ncbi:hypothetical protein B5F07_05995, partial [Lachnoclostridium sp. An169]|uniref:hypothetical protein n=1 Tax=Lachnoclostridium sp. An169 TaxID=1965569 RepID=UPI000B577DBB
KNRRAGGDSLLILSPLGLMSRKLPLQTVRLSGERRSPMDRLTPGNYNGIQVRYLLDWLIETKD